MINIAIFASGAGSNAAVIINTLPNILLEKKVEAKIAIVISNNEISGVLKIAEEANIPNLVIDIKNKLPDQVDEIYISVLKKYNIDFIILAGYLKKIPLAVIKLYPQKIINIHPALLPSYGGKGMYGMNIHKAVVKNSEKESGISIHFVNEVYDEGKIIFQKSCEIDSNETPESLAKKILTLEHNFYSTVIGDVISKM